MKLLRISLSFPGGDNSQEDRSIVPVPWRLNPQFRALSLDPHEFAARIAAIGSTAGGGSLTADELAVARRHVASIRIAWGDFQSNLDDDRMLLQIARRVQLLEVLEELQHRQAVAVTRLDPRFQPRETVEAQA